MPMPPTSMRFMDKLDDLQDSVAALRCLGELLAEAVHREATAIDRTNSRGLHLLFELPLRDLEGHVAGMAETHGIFPEGARGWRFDAERHAQFHGAPEAAPADALDRLRGADFARIARSVHLEEATVRRVVDRLLAEPAAEPDGLADAGWGAPSAASAR